MCGVDQDCVPAPPTGWIGPGVWGPIVDGCGVDQAPLLTAGESTNADVCPCEARGFSCNGGVIDLYSAQLCSAASLVGDNVVYPAPGTCGNLGSYPAGLKSATVIASPTIANIGTCVLATGAVPSPTIVNGNNLCGLTSQSSCGSGFACTPSGSAACIAIEDPSMTGQCPVETYPNMVGRPKTATQACDCGERIPHGSCQANLSLHKTAACDNEVASIDTSTSGCPTISITQGDVYAELVLDEPPTCGEGISLVTEQTWLVCCR
ncbi:MAG: hypothetical protein HOV80_17050, partial [Polyangiaceae bacterium]|nr:hypothetical protein [Polyangiaceae bacterium]